MIVNVNLWAEVEKMKGMLRGGLRDSTEEKDLR